MASMSETEESDVIILTVKYITYVIRQRKGNEQLYGKKLWKFTLDAENVDRKNIMIYSKNIKRQKVIKNKCIM